MMKHKIIKLLLLLVFLFCISACTNKKAVNIDKEYEVVFKDGDGNVLKTEYVKAGEEASPPDIKDKDDRHFVGWSDNYSKIDDDMTIVACYADDDNVQIKLSDVEAKIGDVVTIIASINQNPGILGMTLRLDFDDDALLLKSVEKGAALSELSFTAPKGDALVSGCKILWDGIEVLPEDVSNGDMLFLTFAVKESASAKDYAISLLYDSGQIIDNDMKPLTVSISEGVISVKKG